jgi:cytosine/adenosine deaminase-related metal-dependent hydrolase
MAMSSGEEQYSEPGWVNAHTHLYSGLAPLNLPAPSPPPINFVEILERLWWKLDRALDEPSLRAAARLYVAEALLEGTTALVDHHESPNFIAGSLNVLAEVCEELGMRAVLCYGATERNGGLAEARAGLEECRRFAVESRSSLAKGVVGLHASFTVSDETIEDAAALCRELDTVLHVHVAEDRADVSDAELRGYRGPLERLLELGALPPGSILAHGIHLTVDEVREAERQALWLVQNPRSNEGNRVGYARTLWASSRVALGTDGFPSNMRAEYEALERLARQHDPEHSADALLRGRWNTGRQLASEILSRGDQPADQVFLVSTPTGPAVERVTVAGRVVVENGQLVDADLEEIRAHAREQAVGLARRMEAL